MRNLDKQQKKIIYFFERVVNSDNFRQQVLLSLADLFNLDHSTFFLINPDGKLVDPVALNVDSRSAARYVEHFQEKDIFHPNNLPPRKNIQSPIMYITDVMPLKKYEQTEYYNDFIKTQGFYHEMIMSLSVKGKLLGGIGLYKPKEKSFDREIKSLLKMINNFLSGLLAQDLALKEAVATQQLYQYCISENPVGIIIFDEEFSIIFSNASARELASTLLPEKLNLEQFVKYAFSLSGISCRDPKSSSLNLFSPTLKEFSIKIIPLTAQMQMKQKTYLMKLVPGNPGLLRNHPQQVRSAEVNMKEKYSLTNREVEILSLVLKGLTNQEIAQSLYISPSTVKAHLRSILKKTGTENRLRLYQKINA